jgi:hypothetical protein
MYNVILIVSVGSCAHGNELGAPWKVDNAVTVKDCYMESVMTILI